MNITAPGWTIELSSEVSWNVFLAVPPLFAPTHSSTISLESVTLQPNTNTFISFEPQKYEFLKYRGYFNSKQYCQDDIEFTDTVACVKRCMLRNIKVEVKNDFSLNYNICCRSTVNQETLMCLTA